MAYGRGFTSQLCKAAKKQAAVKEQAALERADVRVQRPLNPMCGVVCKLLWRISLDACLKKFE